MLAAGDSVTVWYPSQMCRMCSAAEDKELSMSTFNYSRYDQTQASHGNFLVFDVPSPCPNEIHLTSDLSLKSCCPKWAECDGLRGHPHLGQSQEHVSVTSQSCHWTPLQTSSENLCNHSLGEYKASAEYQLSSKLPQMPCLALNPDVMAKRSGTVWFSFQLMSQDQSMYGHAVCSFESQYTMPCPPSSAIMGL